MFVGHYAASLMLKQVDRRLSLGWLFLAVQFVDILFFPLVLLGIERLNIVENYTASTHFELVYMPFTHSLVASFIWAFIVYGGVRLLSRKQRWFYPAAAGAMALAVLSHWFLDLLVHTPDLPLLGDSSLKLGLGLWNHALATYLLEAGLLMLGLFLYLKSTRGSGFLGKYGMIMFTVFLLLANGHNIFGPPMGESVAALSVSALMSYFGFAGLAFWLDRYRH
ncbi:MAG: hypothetical protein GXO78_07320 [Calditrichaeota bacterium]|nr:hypothetical protein [Calditrichota bacterium]